MYVALQASVVCKCFQTKFYKDPSELIAELLAMVTIVALPHTFLFLCFW